VGLKSHVDENPKHASDDSYGGHRLVAEEPVAL
jgi:hypothetical protein